MKPRVFISAVSSELKSARQLVANALVQLGYEPDFQDIFRTESGDLRQVLRDKIDQCEGLIQLVGRGYGAEPPTVDAQMDRVSYTQYEFLYAQQRSKKTWVIFVEGDCCDRQPAELDLPVEADHPDPAFYQSERQSLQDKWRAGLKTKGIIRYRANSKTELELRIERLNNKFERMRRWLHRWQKAVVMTSVTTVLLLLIVLCVLEQLGKDIESLPEKFDEAQRQTVVELTNPEALATSIRKRIEAAANEKIDAVPRDEPGWGAMVAEIQRQRDVQLARVDDLVQLIQDSFAEAATEDFQRAVEILNDAEHGGIDAAIAYLESRRPSTLEIARRQAQRAEEEREERNLTLQALALEAELRETRLDWPAALELRRQVAELAPDWFEARNSLGMLLDELAKYDEAEPHKRAAVALATIPEQEAAAFGNLAELLKDTSRLTEAEPLMRRALAIDEQSYGEEHPRVAIRLNNLAQLFQATNRFAEAEPLMRRALAIDEQFYGAEHPRVARDLNNLAALLQATNRLTEAAEPLMRRALAIDEQFYGAEHPRVAIDLNNLAQLLQATNRLAEAEPLMRHALVIDEQSYGSEHPFVAIDLNNLAQLLQATNRLAEAEPLMRRAFAIDEQSYGTEHPRIARDLNNLAALLQATKRLAEAEPLMRRALAIEEESSGSEHPEVARDLNNLAQLLQDTNRLTAAEPLMRRALAIDEQSFGSEHPEVAIRLNNLAQLLQTTNRLAEAEPLYRRALAVSAMGLVKDHPNTIIVRDNYRQLLAAMQLAEAEIERRVQEAMETTGPLAPIAPEVDRLLGPAQPVAEVLAALDQQYQAEGKPEIYFLPADQPIAPHLAALLAPTRDGLSSLALNAYFADDNAMAVILYEAAEALNDEQPDADAWLLLYRMNRAAALRNVGALEQALEALQQVAAEMQNADTPATALGRCHHHLALCEFQLGEAEAAQASIANSLRVYADASEDDPVPSPLLEQSQQLQALLESGEKPPLRENVDVEAELQKAGSQLLAADELAILPLSESSSPLLQQLLGPAPPVDEVLESIDEQYRAADKPPVWFLPLDQPIAPQLDELLGPPPNLRQEL